MQRRLISIFTVSVLITPGLAGQQWSAEQQELIDFGDACWTTWATEDWDAYARACPADPNLVLGHESKRSRVGPRLVEEVG